MRRDEGAKLVEGTLEDAVHDFLVEESVRIVNLVRNHRVIFRHEHLTLGVEMYDGILCHVAEDVDCVACEAYLSLRCAVRQADDVRLEVGGYEVVAQIRVGKADDDISGISHIGLFVDVTLHASLRTEHHEDHIQLYVLVDRLHSQFVDDDVRIVGHTAVSDKIEVYLSFFLIFIHCIHILLSFLCVLIIFYALVLV